eukprot:CAMPEP_0202907174 /NCGR_PEP_ID=MMETSP1392-20130828/41627_1 /ASSEMBLY_ACC=CAM_ASM_000868 /TAXON_ID=225041 /ORGANISM="Chlamydomonas chlamydogama, Strain SAG 11-48b" /LENGTH=195 /DNA_ID=CAMNT_0049595967 /DNA_START=71 /DNA_END=655 /DNA_ORIENTATION=+
MAQAAVWYIVVGQAQPAGPYDEAALKGLAQGGYITADTSTWREGLAEWKRLAEIDELKQVLDTLQVASAAAPSTGPKPDAADDDDLAAFNAEIEALEQEAGADEVAQAPGTPEELEFEDDDGTMYMWDRTMRKYVAKGEGPPSVSFDEMVYAGDDEVIPTIAAARAAEEASALTAERGGQDGGRGRGGRGGRGGR